MYFIKKTPLKFIHIINEILLKYLLSKLREEKKVLLIIHNDKEFNYKLTPTKKKEISILHTLNNRK